MVTSTPSPLPDVTGLFTAVVSDVLDSVGLRHQVVDPRVRPLDPTMKFFGRARTFEVVPVLDPPLEPYKHLIDGIAASSKGDVLVADLGGRTESGFFGGLLATACQVSGISAAVIDGAVRDHDELTSLGFPTFSAGLNAADSHARDEATAFDVEVEIGGVRVAPGDFLLGDADGIVVVPSERQDEVFTAARDKVRRENGMRQALIDGMPIDEAFRTFKVL